MNNKSGHLIHGFVSSSRRAALVLVSLIALGTSGIAVQRGGTVQTVRQPARGKMTLTELTNAIKEVSQGKRDPFAVESDVRARGVDFEATESVIDELRNAGAWAEIRALVSKNDTKAPPPPPVKPTGKLTVACEPVDCRLIVRAVDGTTFSSRTTNKSAAFESVAAGPVEIIAFADGFLESPATIELPANTAIVTSPVILAPYRAAGIDQLRGRSLLLDLFEATQHVDAIEGKGGTLDWRGDDGIDHAWNVEKFEKRPGEDLSISFETRDGQGSCTVDLGDRPRTTCRRSLRGYEEDAERAAKLFLAYQPYDFVRALPTDTVESSADEPRVLLFKLSGGGSAKITLNEEHLAVEIVHEPADGPSLLIEYSSYLSPDEPPGPGRYPMFLHIKTQSGEADWDFKIDGIRRP